MNPRCLIVDDSEAIRFAMRNFLETEGFEIWEAADADSCLRLFAARRPNVVILDYILEESSAQDVIPRLRDHDDNVPIVVLTGHGTIDRAVEMMQLGAANFLTKPVEMPTLAVILKRLVAQQRDTKRRLVREAIHGRSLPDPFAGHGLAIKRARREATLLLSASAPVLITGESGTGKTLAARWLHQNSERAKEPFVVVNCAAIPRDLLEAELFGYQKGAFSGAAGAKPGLLELADRGTLFMDEIGDLDLALQPKLLSAIEERRFRRLGDLREREVDTRILCATHQDLQAAIRAGKFRADLYYRISAMPVALPSLRERREDILDIAEQVLAQLTRDLNKPALRMTAPAGEVLQQYSWPGNIREMRNVLERAAILCEDSEIGKEDLRLGMESPVPSVGDSAPLSLRDMERAHIARVLGEAGGHVEKAARSLDIPRSTLYQKIKDLGISIPRI